MAIDLLTQFGWIIRNVEHDHYKSNNTKLLRDLQSIYALWVLQGPEVVLDIKPKQRVLSQRQRRAIDLVFSS